MQLNARQAALETLVRCRRDGAWASASMDTLIRKTGLDRRDAALAERLCFGVLQNGSLLDYYIDFYCPGKLEPKVRDILRLGVYQILFLDRIPAHAAVSETVALSKRSGCARASGLVNAVLRKIADNRDQLPPIPGEGRAEYLAIRYSHPQWLAEELIAQKGYAFTEAFFENNNEAPALTVQVNTLRVEPADYIRALERAELPILSTGKPEGCIRLSGGVASDLPGYEEGLFYVQDRAARLAVEIAAPEAGMRVLDACACPGGKTFAAAIRMQNQGEILSCDIHEKKLGLVLSGARRLGIDIVSTRAMDARSYDPTLSARFDLVIADVPCSGFGVIGKKPEIRNKNRDDIAALPEIQRAILDNLSRYVAPGGVLLYSTCTVLREENEDVVTAFLSEHWDFTAEPFLVGDIYADKGMYTFWPNVDGTDGFFAAKLRKQQ
ncbi:MAG: 16S rRNA (cytosine(967)-C(5))-methyltransferase RsmB [Oscillospiraceae bacterium]|nr:16S rRNA (cytosine(967)-C(5))-methyltransferase RsmB [Oscillospiraceae bacterium]